MKSKIIKDFRNDLLKRRELVLEFVSQGNPGKSEVMKGIAGDLKVQEENVVLKNVHSNFGRNSFSVNVTVYDSVADKDKTEAKKKVKKESK